MSLASDLVIQLRAAMTTIGRARTATTTLRGRTDELIAEIVTATDGTNDHRPAEAITRLQQAQARLDEALTEFQSGDAAIQAYISTAFEGSDFSGPSDSDEPMAKSVSARRQAPTPWFPQGTEKIPASWGSPKPNKKGEGYRWSSGQAQGVRIDRGNPNSPSPSQRVDHVVIRDCGVVIGRKGEAIHGSIRNDPENAHIPLSEWRAWRRWNSPN